MVLRSMTKNQKTKPTKETYMQPLGLRREHALKQGATEKSIKSLTLLTELFCAPPSRT